MRDTRLAIVGIFALLGAMAASGCQDSQALARLQAGYASLQARQYPAAVASADEFLARSSSAKGAAEAYYLRGQAVERRLKADEGAIGADLTAARRDYESALGLAPRGELLAYLHTALGNTCFWQEDYGAAEVHLAEAVRLLGRADVRPWAIYHLGLTQQRLGKWAAADVTFAGLERQYPRSDFARQAAGRKGAREFYVQVAAFSTTTAAESFRRTLSGQGFPAVRLFRPERNLHVVQSGPLRDWPQAMAMRRRLIAQGYRESFIVP